MDKAVLLDQIDFTQARIEEIEKQVLNYDPDKKAYSELMTSYNKWIDRYNTLMDKLEHFDDISVEAVKLNLERDKMTIQEQLEQDKLNLESEKLRFEREKFAKEIEDQKRKAPVDIIFKSAELGVKVLVPVCGLVGTIGLAKLAYMNDLNLQLCNGTVRSCAKDLLKIATTKV